VLARNTRQPAADADQAVKQPEDAGDLRAERNVKVWIVIALVLAAVLAMTLQLVSRDMNSGEPTVEDH
jgi:uncharacterized membrane protein